METFRQHSRLHGAATLHNSGNLPDEMHTLPDGVTKCPLCDENGHVRADINCLACHGVGYHGVETGPCDSPKGTLHRQLVYRARRQHGVRMFNACDAVDFVPNMLNREPKPVPWTVPEVTDWDDED